MKLLVLLGLISVIAAVQLIPSNPAKRIDNKYIVVFHKNVTEDAVFAYFTYATQQSLKIKPFEIGTFKGVFTTLNTRQLLEHITFDDTINYIEQDHEISLKQDTCITQQNAVWGLDRLSERLLDLTDASAYIYESKAGSGVTSYIVDTGIRISHTEFGGRATWGANFVDTDDTDCNGHGTHVAGTVAGKTYGVAKGADVVAVKVLNCAGSGTWSGVISGIEFVATKGKKPGNANLSLGGGKSSAINDAIAAAVDAGFPFIVAAGNDDADACNVSPASEPSAITVGATELGDNVDARSYFSNYGTCVDIFAPGSLITSAWYTSDVATNRISGTSMAAPHVAGLASLIQGADGSLTPAEVAAKLISDATSNVIALNCVNAVCEKSPNLMAYHNCA